MIARAPVSLARAALAAMALLWIAPALAQTPFPEGWRRLERAPIVLGSGARLTVHLAESPRRGAFLFVTDPLPAAEAGAAWQAVLDRLLGKARVRQDLGVKREPRGERRTRVVEGAIVAGDGKPRRAFGEAQLVAGPQGVWLTGFLNAQDDAEAPAVYEAAANWVVAATPRVVTAAAAAAPAPKATAQVAAPQASAPQAAVPQAAVPQAAAPPPPPAVLAPPPAESRRRVFPASLGPGWRKAGFAGGDFDKQAKLAADGLVVDIPQGTPAGGTGIVSTQPVLRLGEFRPGASATVSLVFDPARTTAVMIFLCPGRTDHCGSDRGLTVYWRRAADGSKGTLIRTWASGRKAEAATGPDLSTLRIAITPQTTCVEAAGASLDGEVESMRPHASLEIGALAAPETHTGGAKMALLSIDVAQTQGPIDPARPAAGVPALPAPAPIFAGAESADWKPFAAHGGDFAKFARWGGGALAVEVPEKRVWATAGIISEKPILPIPRLSGRAPALLKVALDPARSKSALILVNRGPTPDIWLQQVIWALWKGRPDGGGRLTLSLCASPHRLFAMEIPPGWDGRMEIEASHLYAVARLAPGWTIGGYADCLHEGQSYHVSALAQPDVENAPASIALRRVEVGRVTPDGMTALDRLEYLDAKEFRPDEFLDVVAGALDAGEAPPPAKSDGAKP